jgi:hypothetical protein
MPEIKGLTLLPPAPGLCQSCACDHIPEEPHNWQSMFWAFWFDGVHGRSPTLEDAFAHCSADTCDRWATRLDGVPHDMAKQVAVRVASLAASKRAAVNDAALP